MLMHIYGIEKNGTDGPYLQGRNRGTDIENELVVGVGETVGGWIERVALMYIFGIIVNLTSWI